MDWSDQDWEKALSHYENVVACGNESLQIKATIKLAAHVKHAPVYILSLCIPILAELVGTWCTGSSPSIQEAAVFCLKCFACHQEGNMAEIMAQSGVIPSLLNLLPHSGGHFQIVLLKCLRNIVIASDTSRLVLAKHGGLDIILNMLISEESPDDLRQILLEILSALALVREARMAMLDQSLLYHSVGEITKFLHRFVHQITVIKVKLGSNRRNRGNGGIRFLVESARTGRITSRTRAAQAIGLLGLIRRARQKLVDSGALQVLIELFKTSGPLTKIIAGNALGVISSHVDYLLPVAQSGAIPLFAELMESPQPMGKEIAEDVFSILAVNERSARTIMSHLVRILGGDDGEAKAAAAKVLWNLCGYEHSSTVIGSSGAIPVLVRLLRDGNIVVREKVSGVVSQLSYNEEDRVELSEAGAIPLLVEMLQDESQEVRDNAAEALVRFSEDTSLSEGLDEAIGVPSFENMQVIMGQIRRSGVEHYIRSLGQMSID